MNEFFSYETLGKLAGTTLATTLIVQFIKDLIPFNNIIQQIIKF